MSDVMKEYERQQVNRLGQAVSTAVKAALEQLETGKLIVVENLNISIRYATGGGAVSCDTHISGEAKLTVEPDQLGKFIKSVRESSE